MDDSQGDYLCVDMNPAPGGHVGQVIKIEAHLGPQEVLAKSFLDWLGQFAADLEAGKFEVSKDGSINSIESPEKNEWRLCDP
jgi:cell wall assembly regulator SMI1